MENKTLRVGLVGTGFMGRVHASCWLAVPGAELAAIADPTPENRDKCPGRPRHFASHEEMLAGMELDVVDVCTPTPWHAETAIAGLEAGCHVLCEKPMALTLEQCGAMLRAAEAAPGFLMIAHVIRFWPEYVELKKIADSGAYGALRSFAGLRRMAVPMYNWRMWTHDEALAGGIPFEGHIHDVDFLRHLLGDPDAVFAAATRDETGINQVWGTFLYGDGRRASLEGSWGYQPSFPFQHGFVADFEGATVELNLAREHPLVLYRPTGDPLPIVPDPVSVRAADAGGNISDLGGYYREIAYFADCARRGEPPAITTAADAVQSTRLLLAEIQSIQTGRVVNLADVPTLAS